jgi:hypothetical protein
MQLMDDGMRREDGMQDGRRDEMMMMMMMMMMCLC